MKMNALTIIGLALAAPVLADEQEAASAPTPQPTHDAKLQETDALEKFQEFMELEAANRLWDRLDKDDDDLVTSEEIHKAMLSVGKAVTVTEDEATTITEDDVSRLMSSVYKRDSTSPFTRDEFVDDFLLQFNSPAATDPQEKTFQEFMINEAAANLWDRLDGNDDGLVFNDEIHLAMWNAGVRMIPNDIWRIMSFVYRKSPFTSDWFIDTFVDEWMSQFPSPAAKDPQEDGTQPRKGRRRALSEEQEKKIAKTIAQMWVQMDKDKSGDLTREEFLKDLTKQGYSEEEAQAQVENAFGDKNALSLKEFDAVAFHVVISDMINKLWEQADKDQSGDLTREEFLKMIKEQGVTEEEFDEAVEAAFGDKKSISRDEFDAFALKDILGVVVPQKLEDFKSNLSAFFEKTIEEIWTLMDKDQSGHVTRDEFLKAHKGDYEREGYSEEEAKSEAEEVFGDKKSLSKEEFKNHAFQKMITETIDQMWRDLDNMDGSKTKMDLMREEFRKHLIAKHGKTEEEAKKEVQNKLGDKSLSLEDFHAFIRREVFGLDNADEESSVARRLAQVMN